ncbi:hypothetical protein C8J57DRAFT_1220284 [Mycena rebaudengoi]|nr:hypothetical protein C8J57DRAFT_1220284 [Mycena rebaudengoi]
MSLPRSFVCWATSAILQRYLNNVRGYQSGKKNPSSGVNRRRQRVALKGRQEAEQDDSGHRASASPPIDSPSNDSGHRTSASPPVDSPLRDAFGEPDVSSSGTPTVSIADSDGDMLNELSEADSDCRKNVIHLVSAPKLSQDVSRSYAIS